MQVVEDDCASNGLEELNLVNTNVVFDDHIDICRGNFDVERVCVMTMRMM